MNDPAPAEIAEALEQFRVAAKRSDGARARVRTAIEAQIRLAPALPTVAARRFGIAVRLASSIVVVGALWSIAQWVRSRPSSRSVSDPVVAPVHAALEPAAAAPLAAPIGPSLEREIPVVLAPFHDTTPKVRAFAVASRGAHVGLPHAAAPEPDPSASDELQLVQAAQQAIGTHAPQRAIDLLDAYAANHHGGVYLEERRAAHAMARCTLGVGDDARSEARSFLRAFASSPSAPRVRSLCGIDVSPTMP